MSRKGKVLHEFLMHRGFLKSATPSGEYLVALLVDLPVPLSSGKSHWHLFSAAAQFSRISDVWGTSE